MKEWGGRVGGLGERNSKGSEETLWCERHIYYFDCGDGFMGIKQAKFIKVYTLHMCALL